MNHKDKSLVILTSDASPGFVMTMTVFGLSHLTFVFPNENLRI
jgi:hypothetical protein